MESTFYCNLSVYYLISVKVTKGCDMNLCYGVILNHSGVLVIPKAPQRLGSYTGDLVNTKAQNGQTWILKSQRVHITGSVHGFLLHSVQ